MKDKGCKAQKPALKYHVIIKYASQSQLPYKGPKCPNNKSILYEWTYIEIEEDLNEY